jgi:hypothetical protein
MTGPGASPERRTRYLLGLASEAEKEEVEAEYFADDESFERLNAAEDELFDAYAAGRLSLADQAAFRQRYLASSEGRWRLTFARALRQRSEEAMAGLEAGPRRGALRSAALWAAVAAGLAAGSTAVWLAGQNARLQGEVQRLRAERRSEPPTVAPPQTGATESLRSAVQAVRIPVQSPRGPIEVALAPGTRSIRLEVALRGDEDSATFDAVIRRPGGAEVWRQEGLAPKRFGAPLVVMAPAAVLTDGEYVLSVEGEESRDAPQRTIREHRLRLVRKP